MIFIDSWIWIEFFTDGEKFLQSKAILEKIVQGKDKALVSTFVLTEVKYRLSALNPQFAHEQIHLIETFPHLTIIPVTSEIALMAADLRRKYYSAKKQVSYGDMIHLATAVICRCEKLFSGDPDFEGIEEIETVVVK